MIWFSPTEKNPADTAEPGDRVLVLVYERPRYGAQSRPRLVTLEATEHGWESSDPSYGGYGPEDGVLWAWERDIIRAATAPPEPCRNCGGPTRPLLVCPKCSGF